MWTLFHVLSIEALRRGEQSRFREVPQAIFGFIKNFFSCKYCARHFVEMATESWEEFHDLAEMVLWLWSRHNKVSRPKHHNSYRTKYLLLFFEGHSTQKFISCPKKDREATYI
jgi:hypothetical protein